MKYILTHRIFKLLFLSILILGGKPVFGQWECIYCNGGNSLPFKFEKIHFKDTMNGFGICYLDTTGFLGRTLDGGHNWDTISTQNHPIDFIFINDSVGILTGDEGISKTTDGGDTWILKDTILLWTNNIQFPSDSIGYAIGVTIDHVNYTSTVTIIKTLDGGENWNIIDTIFLDGWLRDVIFVTNNLGFLSSDSVIYKTIDGGVNWSPNTINSYHIQNFEFVNDSLGYFMGSNLGIDSLRLYKTIDEGNNWKIHSKIYSFNGISDMIFVNDTVGYITGTWQVQKTIDGGKNWYYQYATNTQFPSFYDNTYFFSFIDDSHAFLAGGFWTTALFKTSNGGGSLPISISEPPIDLHLSIYPNPATDDLRITFENNEFRESETGLIRILNINGQVVDQHKFKLIDKSLALKIGHYTPGIYLLQFESKSHFENIKFVVQ